VFLPKASLELSVPKHIAVITLPCLFFVAVVVEMEVSLFAWTILKLPSSWSLPSK
jgi:hypothetical protein